jgi:hypothetical protein
VTTTSIRAADLQHCTAGLLRFATPAELDALLGHLRHDRPVFAHVSHGMPNRAVAEAMLRRPDRGLLLDSLRDSGLIGQALVRSGDGLLGRLLDLDDPEVNFELFVSGHAPRNLNRQLAHQTSRRDGVTPVPFPPDVWKLIHEKSTGDRLRTAMLIPLLHAADADLAGHALRALRRGADPHGAIRACRTLLDAGREHELRDLLSEEGLPDAPWGPDESLPSVRAYAQAALVSSEGAARLREMAEWVRRPEWLRSVADLTDADACAPWSRPEPAVIRTIVHRRHPAIPRVDWPAVLDDEPRRRRAEGPLPRRAARMMALRTDTPPELMRLLISDHPGLAPLICDPTPELLAGLCERRSDVGAQAVVKMAGNGLVAGTLTAEDVVGIVPADVLELLAVSLWLPGLRGTAAVRALIGRTGDVPLRPFFVEETGHGPHRRLRSPQVRSHWDPEAVYGKMVAAAVRHYRDTLTADQVLAMVTPDAVLAPDPHAMPDPRVLLRLADLIHEHLGGRPEAWMVALRLLKDGFVGTLPELVVTAGAVGS